MKNICLIILFASTAAWSKTYDFSHQFGVGGNIGWAYPVLSKEFKSRAKDELMTGLHLRYHTSKFDALLFNYSYHEFENTLIDADVYDISYVFRINELDKMTPILGIGVGVADMDNIEPFKDNLKFAARARLGVEYALNSYFLLSLFADYLYVGKMPHNDEDEPNELRGLPGQEIHAIIPQVSLTIYFDKK